MKKEIQSETVSLDFLGNDEELCLKYERIIEREINKTVAMKLKDFEELNPTLGMVGGGNNDVFAVVMQFFACMSSFVKFFIREGYTRNPGLKEDKPFCVLLNRVFSILWRRDELGLAAPFMDVAFLQ